MPEISRRRQRSEALSAFGVRDDPADAKAGVDREAVSTSPKLMAAQCAANLRQRATHWSRVRSSAPRQQLHDAKPLVSRKLVVEPLSDLCILVK